MNSGLYDPIQKKGRDWDRRGGVRAIQWVGRRAGTYDLQWKHCREWEGEGSVIGRFQASLIEKADPINVGYAKQTLF